MKYFLIFLLSLVLCCTTLLNADEQNPVFHPNQQNIYSFPASKCRYLRLWMQSGDRGTVALDEVEVFPVESKENIALSSLGTTASASSCIEGYPIHKIEHLNDGLYGAANSWVATDLRPWIQLEFRDEQTVDRVGFSRDRKEPYSSDRIPVDLEIQISQDGEHWVTVRQINRFSTWLDGNNNDRPMNTPKTVRRAVLNMISEHVDRFPDAEETLAKLDEFETRFQNVEKNSPRYDELQNEFAKFQRRVLLANPVLDFDRILVIRGNRMAAPNNNFVTMEDVPKDGFDNELAVLSRLREEPVLTSLYRPESGRPLGEPELHWDGQRIMFSSISEATRRWAVFEIHADGTNLRTLTPSDQPDIDFFDSCYAPDGTIITASTATMQGLPCLNGGAPMVNLFKVDPETKKTRQLTFEQDSDWHPTLMRDGRIMYMRWEYTDIMHYFSRILFHMNPDGTNQRELYGSGSYFPTTLKHAREIPGTSEIVVILSGHHGRGDTGRMAIIDPTIARKYPFQYTPATKEWGIEGNQIDLRPEVLSVEKTGFVQEIPGFGLDVVGNVLDNQADGLKYNFVFPYPLSKNDFLVNCQIAGDPTTYGLYLVDRFDNMTLIKKIDGEGLFNPIPLVKHPSPRFLPDRTLPGSDTATVYITDIYNGHGMQGVPEGTVKSLRVFSYHFAYNDRGGHESLGVQTSWDVKRIVGEVAVEPDGSVMFEIPCNTPISLQPLDQDGRAIQLMRSWLVGMPGENVSCNGCHESQLDVTPIKSNTASRRAVQKIKPFFGEPRSVAFETEVFFPVVKKYCLDCHDGTKATVPSFVDAKKAYDNIHPFVRRPGPETDMDVLTPMEYHASTSELCQMFEKNHYHVVLDDEAKRRIYCWIDANAPWGGKWDHPKLAERRKELEALYSGTVNDYENDFDRLLASWRNQIIERVPLREEYRPRTDSSELCAQMRLLADSKQWPLNTEAAVKMQAGFMVNGQIRKTVELSPGVTMNFVRIPAGTFIMGSLDGCDNESPRNVVAITEPFWMSETEVTNSQYAIYDPDHDSRYIEEHGKDHIVPGYIANHADQPVSRVSWDEAMRFAKWLSDEFNLKADLPTEAQWEWAARAGTETHAFFGSLETDFSNFANLAGAERRYLYTSWINGATLHRRNPYPLESVFPLRDDRFSDKWFTVDYVAQYESNPLGLYDMIGNNAEWTKSNYRPYPYCEQEQYNDPASRERKTVRGGSWHDRPKVSGSAARFGYEPWQKVHNVGIRLILR